MPINLSRHGLLTAAAVALIGAAPLASHAGEDLDPTDTVPRYLSIAEFRALSDAELYMVDLAIKRGRRIVVAGHSASESRRMIESAAEKRF
jgi:predicted outer membrane protein